MKKSELNLNHLKFFICAAESKSIREVAEKMNYNPANISINITKLENQYGAKLFYRDPLELTEIGKKVYEHVRKGYREIEFSEIIVKQMNDMANAKFTIGCPPHMLNLLFSRISKLIDNYPDIKIKIDTDASCTSLIEKLKDNKIKFAILDYITDDQKSNNIETVEVSNSEYVFLAKDKIKIKKLKDLEKYKYILSYDNRNATKKLKNTLEEENVKIESVINCLDTNVRIKFAKLGVGIAYVIRDAALGEIERKELYEMKLPIKLPSTSINLVYLKNHLSEIEKQFISQYLKIKI